MSANPVDASLERLNYFNGQRLAATDFRSEQGHHVGMRRVLNRSLYSAGIVTGLEVEKDPANKHRVIVRRGLAFDHLGREIFVPEDVSVPAAGAPSTKKGVVFGNLLVVSYREQRRHPVSDGCAVAAPVTPCSGDLAWGAPTRIVADAVFEVLDSWPADDSGRIVLAQLELAKNCQVARVLPGVRKYAVPVKPQRVRTLSLEGEKSIDKANPKVLFFHVEGGAPDSVTLYLYGRKFNSLYYTELGKHSHPIDFDTSSVTRDLTHAHTMTAGGTAEAGEHTHPFLVDDGELKGGIDVNTTNMDTIQGENPIKPAGKHTHALTGFTLSSELGPAWNHFHDVKGNTDPNGVTDVAARIGKPALSLLAELKVFLDTQDITAKIADQLEAKPGQAGKWKLVVGADVRLKGPALNTLDGTGEIDVLKLGVEIGLGQHRLEFRVVDPDVGGTIQYNLYVS